MFALRKLVGSTARPYRFGATIQLSTDVRLEAGDKLFAEIYKDGATLYNVSINASDTWFNGHLVTRL